MSKQDGAEGDGIPNFDGSIQEMEEVVRRERDKAQKFVQAMDRLLDELERVKLSEGGPSEPRRRDSGPFRYLGLPMIEAIEIFLEKAGTPQTREQIIAEMKDGDAVLAQQRPDVQVNKTIDYWCLSEAEKQKKYSQRKIKIVPQRLKRFGDKIGRVGWPREK